MAFLGNAVHGLQAAYVVAHTRLRLAPPADLPGQATGYWADLAGVLAQVVLASRLRPGAVYMFVRRGRAAGRERPATAARGTGSAPRTGDRTGRR